MNVVLREKSVMQQPFYTKNVTNTPKEKANARTRKQK